MANNVFRLQVTGIQRCNDIERLWKFFNVAEGTCTLHSWNQLQTGFFSGVYDFYDERIAKKVINRYDNSTMFGALMRIQNYNQPVLSSPPVYQTAPLFPSNTVMPGINNTPMDIPSILNAVQSQVQQINLIQNAYAAQAKYLQYQVNNSIQHNQYQPNNVLQRQESMVRNTAPKLHSPVNKTAPKLQSPVNKAAPKLMSPVNKAAPKLQSPVNKTAPKLHSPVNKTAPKLHSPVNKAAPKLHSPVNKTAPKLKTPVNKAAPKLQSPVNKTAPKLHSPVNKTAPKLQCPVNKTAPKLQSPVNKVAPKLQSPVNKAAPKLQTSVSKAAPKLQSPVNKAAPKLQSPVNKAAPKLQSPVNKTAPKRKRSSLWDSKHRRSRVQNLSTKTSDNLSSQGQSSSCQSFTQSRIEGQNNKGQSSTSQNSFVYHNSIGQSLKYLSSKGHKLYNKGLKQQRRRSSSSRDQSALTKVKVHDTDNTRADITGHSPLAESIKDMQPCNLSNSRAEDRMKPSAENTSGTPSSATISNVTSVTPASVTPSAPISSTNSREGPVTCAASSLQAFPTHGSSVNSGIRLSSAVLDINTKSSCLEVRDGHLSAPDANNRDFNCRSMSVSARNSQGNEKDNSWASVDIEMDPGIGNVASAVTSNGKGLHSDKETLTSANVQNDSRLYQRANENASSQDHYESNPGPVTLSPHDNTVTLQLRNAVEGTPIAAMMPGAVRAEPFASGAVRDEPFSSGADHATTKLQNQNRKRKFAENEEDALMKNVIQTEITETKTKKGKLFSERSGFVAGVAGGTSTAISNMEHYKRRKREQNRNRNRRGVQNRQKWNDMHSVTPDAAKQFNCFNGMTISGTPSSSNKETLRNREDHPRGKHDNIFHNDKYKWVKQDNNQNTEPISALEGKRQPKLHTKLNRRLDGIEQRYTNESQTILMVVKLLAKKLPDQEERLCGALKQVLQEHSNEYLKLCKYTIESAKLIENKRKKKF